MSGFKGAALMLNALPNASALLGDKGYDVDWFRAAQADRGVTACIPSKANRKLQVPHNRTLYRQRHRVENIFGKLKDWRRIHTRYDRCAHIFMSGNLHRCNRHLLARSMSPEPNPMHSGRGRQSFRDFTTKPVKKQVTIKSKRFQSGSSFYCHRPILWIAKRK